MLYDLDQDKPTAVHEQTHTKVEGYETFIPI